MRGVIQVLLVGGGVLATTQAAVADTCGSLVRKTGASWYVTPSGDALGLTDGVCIQRAFDAAQVYQQAHPSSPKPKVVFKAKSLAGVTTPFYLGEMMAFGGPDAELSTFHTSRGSFDWHADFQGLQPGGAMVTKPIKIRAPVVALGETGSEIVSLGDAPEMVPNAFFIDHADVEIRHITFTGGGIVTIHGGLTVDSCEFTGETNIVLFLDDRSIYPHYDDPNPKVRFSQPRKTRITNNDFTALWRPFNFPLNVFWYASEVTFQGNTAYSEDSGLFLGGLAGVADDPDTVLPDGTPLGEVYSTRECRNNVIGGPGAAGNAIDAWWGAINFSGHGSATEDNLIINNDLTSFVNPIWAWAHEGVSWRRNKVIGNRLETAIRGIYVDGTASGFASHNVIANNTITGAVDMGMWLKHSDQTLVAGNSIATEGAIAGILNDSDQSFLTLNTIQGSAEWGILVRGDGNLVVANRFEDFDHFEPDPQCETSDADHSDLATSTVSVTDEPPGPGSALQMDGAFGHGVQVPDDESLRFMTERITVAAWVHPTAGSGGWRTIVSKTATWPTPLYFGLADNNVFFHLAGPLNGNWFPEGVTVDPGAWTHLAVSYDGSWIRMYKDGDLVASLPTDGDLDLNGTSSTRLYIGANQIWRDQVFDGLLDDVALWDEALSHDDIADLYAGASLPDEVGTAPVAWWPCDGLVPGAVPVLEDAMGAHDGFVDPHWCDPDSPFYLPGVDVLFYYNTSDNVLFGSPDSYDLGDNVLH